MTQSIPEQISQLEQELTALDQRRNEIILQISQLKIIHQTETQAITQRNKLTPEQKIKLFRSLFRGREDVYAKHWQSATGKIGYSPHCANEWRRNVCKKPKVKCSACTNRNYVPFSEAITDAHLRGELVAGIYPLTEDEKCYFLAIDFDEAEWKNDVAALRAACQKTNVPVYVERSRSGQGAHVWIFFEDAINACLARKLGSALLTYAMNKRHNISFKSYDRMFPNQDTIPIGGLGNLIALPLQASPRKIGNSVFVDEYFIPYENQWDFLSTIKKLSPDVVYILVNKLCVNSELGVLGQNAEDDQKPWAQTVLPKLKKDDFPAQLEIIKSNMLYLKKEGISQRALNQIKRLAAFKNPEFYKAQAMRMPIFNKPRIISCSDESEKYLALPRGCITDLLNMLNTLNISYCCMDEAFAGKSIKVDFAGTLHNEQENAVAEMLQHDDGVLAATTAFGKTVIAAKLIAERKVNTLILVHRKQLLSQWIKRLSEFLVIDETPPIIEQNRCRKKNPNVIGLFGSGKNQLGSIIDVAIMQSLYSKETVNECVKNYGMIIVDECHHASAFSFAEIIKQANAKYIYGLTATPTRKDGHHPIVFMHCGPIRFRVDALIQAKQRPFEHYIIPRFTGFCLPGSDDEQKLSIQDIYANIVHDEIRNHLIINDVVRCYESGRNCLVLTERTAHVDMLTKMLSTSIPDVIALKGGMGNKETTRLLNQISTVPNEKPLIIVATGRFIGEGFDEPRLDTLFLAMPISWYGTLQQYAGRLHRLFAGKKEVQIYDYVDIRLRVLEKMYNKRLRGYAAIGYHAKGLTEKCGTPNNIYDKHSFFSVYSQDLSWAKRDILIVSPFVMQKRVIELLQILQAPLQKQLKITIITRPEEDFTGKSRIAALDSIRMLTTAGVKILFRRKIHQKFAIIDQKIAWYGSINLLSFGHSEESVMRITSASIASELMESLGMPNLLKL